MTGRVAAWALSASIRTANPALRSMLWASAGFGEMQAF